MPKTSREELLDTIAELDKKHEYHREQVLGYNKLLRAAREEYYTRQAAGEW